MPQDDGSEDAARRFARRRLLMSLQGGLGAGVEAGGGFFGNLLRGASGSLGGTLQANQMQHEEERQSIRDAAEQRRYEEQRDRLNAMLGIQQGQLKISQDREARLSQPQEEPVEDLGLIPAGVEGPLAADQARAPFGLPRAGYKPYAQTLGREMAQSLFAKSDKSKPDGPKLGDINTFSDNFRLDKDVQNYTVVRDNYRRINSTSKLGTGQGDLATIFSFMRVLDPESVVRETEFKNAQEAVGRLQMMYNIPSQWVKGNRLTPEGRAGFRKAAKQLHDTQKRTYDTKKTLYKRQATAYGVDPTLFIPEYDDDDMGGAGADLIYNPSTGELEPAD